jgi:hypothetical protein
MAKTKPAAAINLIISSLPVFLCLAQKFYIVFGGADSSRPAGNAKSAARPAVGGFS